MCLCVYVFMYVCMYVCMYVRMYVRTYACMYACMYVCMSLITLNLSWRRRGTASTKSSAANHPNTRTKWAHAYHPQTEQQQKAQQKLSSKNEQNPPGRANTQTTTNYNCYCARRKTNHTKPKKTKHKLKQSIQISHTLRQHSSNSTTSKRLRGQHELTTPHCGDAEVPYVCMYL